MPRGIGISAYLSEIYMAELDCYIRNYEGVIYYARYVDDIIIIMHKNVDSLSPSMIHSALDKEFYRYGLKLQAKSHSKTSLFDLTVPTLTAPLPKVMNYLGYRINLYRCNGSTTTKYGISDNKKKKVKDRISKSIDYFNLESKYNISRAKDVLFACLKLLSSNLKLSGSKSRVKAGIYYSNNLLDNTNEIEEFDAILSDELTKLNPHDGLFSSTAAKEAFIMRLKKQIVSVANFKRGFDTKRIYKINSETRKVIMKIWQ